ncbi:DNA primase [Idiomarina seosinensis]|uniref:DNA primase n=1 Tax=Idiomarina seosinensis TaxID=281739 RepID=UPI00384F2122
MAGLIPKSFIHDLLDRADIVELVDSRVALKKAGKNYQACCPFHNEKSPSFTVSRDKQFYHCFGCGEHGNAIDFLMNYDGLDFPDAVEELAGIMGLDVPREQTANPQKSHQKQQQLRDDAELMAQCAKYFQHQLKHHHESAKAIDYLKNRGLTGDTVKKFQIGYAGSEWDGLLKTFAKSPGQQQQLVDLKLVNQADSGRHYDFFRQRIMFPIHDRRGRVVGFGGRIIDSEGPKYLNSPETRLFHKGHELYGFWQLQQQRSKPSQVVIVEGYMDVVGLAQAGIDYAVASLGTATTAEQLQRLFRTTTQIICCYDGDRAGRDAAWRALENALPLLKDGVDMRFLFLPDGEDPDSLVRAQGAAAFEQKLNEAVSFIDYFFEHFLADIDPSSDAGRSQLLSQAKPKIEKVASDFYREALMEKLAVYLRREKSQLERYVEKPESQRQAQQTMKMTPLRKAIALLLQYPKLGQTVPLRDELKQLKLPGIELFSQLHQQTSSGLATTAQILESWRDTEYHEALIKLASWEHQLEDEHISAEFNDIFVYLIDQYVEQRANDLLKKEQNEQLTKAEKQEYMMLLRHLQKKR